MDSQYSTPTPSTILKTDALGRVTVTKQQREALLDEFERSGLPATRFAKIAGVRYSTFAWWAQQRRHKRGDYERLIRRGKLIASSAVPVSAVPVFDRPSDSPPPLRLVEAILCVAQPRDETRPNDSAAVAMPTTNESGEAPKDLHAEMQPVPERASDLDATKRSLSAPGEPSAQAAALEIVFAGGARLRVGTSQQLPMAAELLKLLTPCLPC